jgi:hypothetical protein
VKKRTDIENKQGALTKVLVSGVKHLVHVVMDMDRRGVSEDVRHGEIHGKTKDGSPVKITYNYGVKIGLDDVIKKLKKKHTHHGIDRTST